MKIQKWMMNDKMIVVLLILICLVIVIWMITSKWLAAGVEQEATGMYDYAIVLGAKVNGNNPSLTLQKRLEAAILYGKRFPHVTFILSGGLKEEAQVSEARVMKKILTEHGIGEERLILEEKSQTTSENIRNSIMITKLSMEVDGVTIISSDYHLARAKRITEKLGFSTDVVVANSPEKDKNKWIIRERIALLKEMAWPL